MYILSLLLPLYLIFICGFMGRKLGIRGVYWVGVIGLSISLLLNIMIFNEIFLNNNILTIELLNWFKLDIFILDWILLFDDLSSSMLIVVNSVSLIVWIYSYDYMISDPFIIRFYNYILLFVICMIILITTSSLPILFIGWEGILKCLKWYNIENINLINNILPLLHLSKLRVNQKIGPHNIDIISILVGSLLGDSHLEKRKEGIRLIFEQSNKNVEYLMTFHKYLAERGYCNPKIPKLHKRIRKEGKIIFHYRINTYTFNSFIWLYNIFYKWDPIKNKFIKIIPLDIENYLSPLTLAIWFMDDESKANLTLKIATNYFTYKELEFLSLILLKKFNLYTSIHKGGKGKGYILYIKKESKKTFINLIKPYMVKSMYYKLN